MATKACPVRPLVLADTFARKRERRDAYHWAKDEIERDVAAACILEAAFQTVKVIISRRQCPVLFLKECDHIKAAPPMATWLLVFTENHMNGQRGAPGYVGNIKKTPPHQPLLHRCTSQITQHKAFREFDQHSRWFCHERPLMLSGLMTCCNWTQTERYVLCLDL